LAVEQTAKKIGGRVAVGEDGGTESAIEIFCPSGRNLIVLKGAIIGSDSGSVGEAVMGSVERAFDQRPHGNEAKKQNY
jgi:hypothetical protein